MWRGHGAWGAPSLRCASYSAVPTSKACARTLPPLVSPNSTSCGGHTWGAAAVSAAALPAHATRRHVSPSRARRAGPARRAGSESRLDFVEGVREARAAVRLHAADLCLHRTPALCFGLWRWHAAVSLSAQPSEAWLLGERFSLQKTQPRGPAARAPMQCEAGGRQGRCMGRAVTRL